MLESIGIIGWRKIEPVVLSALVTRQPILFVSSHGCNKTDGAMALSKAVIGPGAKYQKYDTHLLKEEEFLGWPDVKALEEGVVRRIATEESIWNANAVLFDELNRVNPFVAAKTMEVVRSRTVMGEHLTKLEYVFASVNPPQSYEAAYLDAALVSRFCVVRVPGSEELLKKAGDFEKILSLDPDPSNRYTEEDARSLREIILLARDVEFSKKDVASVHQTVSSLVSGLLSSDVNVSPRQARNISSLLMALRALSSVSNGVVEDSEDSRVMLVMSMIPDVWNICRRSVSSDMVKNKIKTTLVGLRLGDPMMTSRSLADLVKVKTPDNLHWDYQVKQAIEAEDEAPSLKKFLLGLVKRKEDINKDLFNTVANAAVARWMHLEGHVSDDVPLSISREELEEFVRTKLVKGHGKAKAVA